MCCSLPFFCHQAGLSDSKLEREYAVTRVTLNKIAHGRAIPRSQEHYLRELTHALQRRLEALQRHGDTAECARIRDAFAQLWLRMYGAESTGMEQWQ